jgi:hypothetical protein
MSPGNNKDRQNDLPEDGVNRKISNEDFWPSWIFQHEHLLSTLESAQTLEQDKLINKLNYIHFMNDHVLLLLRHAKYEDSVLIETQTDPCIDDVLTCFWNKTEWDITPANYHFQYLIIRDDHSIILVPATLQEFDKQRIILRLPEKSFILRHRRVQRFACHDVIAELLQSGFSVKGQLIDFSPQAFRVKFNTETSPSFRCYNANSLSVLKLSNNGTIYFSEDCRFIRQKQGRSWREIVFSPVSDHMNRFQTKKIRNPRQHIAPPLTATFEHPFFKKRVKREIRDISISGFSVRDEIDAGILIPGMIIPKLSINYAGTLKLECMAQVLYRRVEGDDACCGFAILDMNVANYSRLNHILSVAADVHASISTDLDMDALWELFFEAGFIYPKKYKSIHSYREEFKETYREIYREGSEIAKHFTYEKDGRIYGHLSMIQAYERAWLIHHHAARTMKNKRPGSHVLKQITLFIHGICQYPSAKMDYVMCYFRPDNEFPNLVFGDFARSLNTQEICSLDLFSYLTYEPTHPCRQLSDDWQMKEISAADIRELEHFYHHHSRGLLLNILNAGSAPPDGDSLEIVSERHGFLRKWQIYSLTRGKKLSAVLIANQSSLGINLSELLNSITIIVIDPENTPWEDISCAVEQLTSLYQIDKVPLLIYPPSYVEEKKISYEKQYQLFILDTNYLNEFMEYSQRRFRIRYE